MSFFNNSDDKMRILETFVNLFWQDGILDKNTLNLKDNKLSNEQSKFIKKYCNNLKNLFNILKKKDIPENQFQLILWLDLVIKDFFGGFIYLDILEKDKTYEIKINQIKYIELILNKNKTENFMKKEYLNKIKKNLANEKCKFSDLHGKEYIRDFY